MKKQYSQPTIQQSIVQVASFLCASAPTGNVNNRAQLYLEGN